MGNSGGENFYVDPCEFKDLKNEDLNIEEIAELLNRSRNLLAIIRDKLNDVGVGSDGENIDLQTSIDGIGTVLNNISLEKFIYGYILSKEIPEIKRDLLIDRMRINSYLSKFDLKGEKIKILEEKEDNMRNILIKINEKERMNRASSGTLRLDDFEFNNIFHTKDYKKSYKVYRVDKKKDKKDKNGKKKENGRIFYALFNEETLDYFDEKSLSLKKFNKMFESGEFVFHLND